MGLFPCKCYRDPPGCLATSCIPGRSASVHFKCVGNTHSSTIYISSCSQATSALLPPPKQPGQGAVVLSSALPPISAKLAQKIKSQQFVAMKELLTDNMALYSQLEDLPTQATLTARPHRLREIESPLSWVFCFLAYLAVRTSDRETRDMLTYARLVIREAQCHGGAGWLEYDKWFRQQQAALTTPQPWCELNASLHAATVMSLRAGDRKLCRLCREADHSDTKCALASLHYPQPQHHLALATPLSSSPPASKRVARPETLERICASWNRGRCAFPGSCQFRHACATCKRKGHRARDCDETSADSPYKTSQHPQADKQDTPQC